MGMFDYINCEYPLPVDDAPKGDYQTKDTPAQSLDFYTIKADGTLWGQEYDIEDRSDPTAKGPLAMRGMMTRVNHREKQCMMTGEVVFYTDKGPDRGGWIQFSAYFKDGIIQQINAIENREE